jgi:hypothetical protein
LPNMAEEALTLSGLAKGVYFTFNPLRLDLLARAANRLKSARKGDLATDADVLRRRWMLLDVDPVRVGGVSATNVEKSKAWEQIGQVRAYLDDLHWPRPVVADSGNGFHLLFRVDLPPDDGGLVKRTLQALAARFDNSDVAIDTSVHNPSRITKLYGTISAKGDSTADRPHRATAVLEVPDALAVVDEHLLGELAARAPVDESCQRPSTVVVGSRPQTNSEAIRRARAYIAQMPGAISGQGGHNATYAVACRLVQGFDLSIEGALPLMLEYSHRCEPPWTEEELIHKLEDADAEPGPRGYLLGQRGSHERSAEEHPLPGPTFAANIPDFMLADREIVLCPLPPRRRGRRRIRYGLYWAIHHAVVALGSSIVVLPDVLLGQMIWGANGWPKNWRRRLAEWADWVGFQTLEQQGGGSCPDFCPFFGTDMVHQHFVYETYEGFLGALEELGTLGASDVCTYDFRRDPKESSAERRGVLKRLRKSGRALAAYLPALLFSGSPRVGLSIPQIRLLRGLTPELTRVAADKPSTRPDRAWLFMDGRVPGASGEGLVICPLLAPERSYVVFGGNAGKRKDAGRGYQIVGRTFKGWLYRAGYSRATIEADRWGTVRQFLRDLADLSGPFCLTPAAYHGRRREWRHLDDMLELTRSGPGRTWIENCRLRIYAPSAYLVLWRRFFAARLGFSYIPGGEWQPPPSTSVAASTDRGSTRVLRTAADVRGWLRSNGMAQKDLAAHLGCSAARVSAQLTGRQRWSRKFQADMNALVQRLGQ